MVLKNKELAEYLVGWIHDRIKATGADGGVVGVSGGVDSAVVLSLVYQACEGKCIGLWMPCFSSYDDEKDAQAVADRVGIGLVSVHLEQVLAPIENALAGTLVALTKRQLANIKARLRMTALYAFASTRNYLVVGTSNLSEYNIGYFTKWGDGACDLEPIMSLYKSEVYELGKYLEVPESILRKAPSAGLWEGQTDEGEMGVTYDQIERFFKGDTELDNSVKERIFDLVSSSNHKRLPIPAPQRTIISTFIT